MRRLAAVLAGSLLLTAVATTPSDAEVPAVDAPERPRIATRRSVRARPDRSTRPPPAAATTAAAPVDADAEPTPLPELVVQVRRKRAAQRERAAERVARARAELRARRAERQERERRAAERAQRAAEQDATAAQTSASLSGIAARVAECESGGDPNAQNPTSSASGLFQFVDSTWESVTGKPAPASAYSVAEQTDAFWALWNGGSGAGNWAPSRHCWA